MKNYIYNKLNSVNEGVSLDINVIVDKVIKGLAKDISYDEVDQLMIETCAYMTVQNPNYDKLAIKLQIDKLHQQTESDYQKVIDQLYNIQLLNDQFYEFACKNIKLINDKIDYKRDTNYDYFGYKTLEKSYLLKDTKGNIIERPQHLVMRCSLAIHLNDLEEAFKTYDYMSNLVFTHATPTLFNAGTKKQQLSSCFLLQMQDDSIEGIYDTLKQCALISKNAGGIGLSVSNIRAKNSYIRGTNGTSNGLVPMLQVFNATARYCDQGGNKRKGSIAIYLEPHHPDIFDFLDLKKNHGKEEARARDLFYALWISDIFMNRVIHNQKWSLMCPDQCPGLQDVYGKQYEELYLKYEQEGKFVKQVDASQLWLKIVESQIETGTPYILYKDSCNSKSNQQNLGTIKSSNLCVKGDTLLLTDQGYKQIDSLTNQSVNVWNGESFSNTTVYQTGTDQQLLKVVFSNGSFIECTPYHKFYTNDNQLKRAHELQVNDQLLTCKLPYQDGDDSYNCLYPYTNAFYQCTGYQHNNQYIIPLQKKHLHLRQSMYYHYRIQRNDDEYNQIILYNEKCHNYIPINGSINNRLQWLAGFIDAQNCNYKLQILSEQVMLQVILLCNTLSVQPKFIDGRLEFTKDDLYYLLADLQLPVKTNVVANLPDYNLSVTSISKVNDLYDTYCFTEPVHNKGFFNGLLTGNCTEIVQYTSKDEVAVCNLASIALPKMFDYQTKSFDYDKLGEVITQVTYNLNKVIDINYYPVKEAENSNFKHRPIGIGIQGFADLLQLLELSYQDDEALALTEQIFETMYYYSMKESVRLAKLHGHYESFKGSPLSKGQFQFDLWNIQPCTNRYDWNSLRQEVIKYGARNSLLIAPMPTASTSQILGNVESFDPVTSNIYTRRVLSGDFICINKRLVTALMQENLWNDYTRNLIIKNNGSIQNIDYIPTKLKNIYKTVWEISQKTIINHAKRRSPYICQSQSLNLYIQNPSVQKISAMQIYAWKQGLKTGQYYLRTRAARDANQFTVNACTKQEGCITCSS